MREAFEGNGFVEGVVREGLLEPVGVVEDDVRVWIGGLDLRERIGVGVDLAVGRVDDSVAEGPVAASDVGDGFSFIGSKRLKTGFGELVAGLLGRVGTVEPEAMVEGFAPELAIKDIEVVVEPGVG